MFPSPQDDVRGLVEDAKGDLWIATRHQGLYRLALTFGPDGRRTPAVATPYFKEPGPLAGVPWVVVDQTGDHQVLAKANDRVCRFDLTRGQFVLATEYGAVPTDGSFSLVDLRVDGHSLYAFG